MFLAKEKALYTTLNMMKMQNTTFIGYFWAPDDQEANIMHKVGSFPTVRVVRYENHNIARPTYVKTNEFTFAFQQIIDTYGIPQYKEANPAIITIVTFPFFFGVMFGDMGHGSILMIEGLLLVLNADKLKESKVGKALARYRYLLFMMGIMATWTGLVYNEFFALKMNLFGSCYDINKPIVVKGNEGQKRNSTTSKWYWTRVSPDCTYPIGMDPVWGQSDFELTYSNSIKMKLSVIFGVVHMSIGIMMKGTNMIF